MRHRKSYSSKRSRRSFKKGNRTHKKNLQRKPMRGGWRL